MIRWNRFPILCAFALCAALYAGMAHAQDKSPDAKSGAASSTADGRLTIIVVGDDKKPVENASVYVKYVEDRKVGKDKKIEMNIKTNQQGVCHLPVVPPEKFMIQVIAEGWKTFGEYYDPNPAGQTVTITLEKPPKWY